jgi:hypothetical protein
MLYYIDTDWQVCGRLVSLPGDIADIAIILARITLLLVSTDACAPGIVNKVWGDNDA